MSRTALESDEVFEQAAVALEIDKKFASRLKREEIGFLVETYYELQELRKRAANRRRALDERSEPSVLMDAYARHNEEMEKRIRGVLLAWCRSDPLSAWAIQTIGVGPVIAAGLAAHVRVERSSSVSSVWRFAGLDPTCKWHGNEDSRGLIKAAREVEGGDVEAVLWLSRATNRHPVDFFTAGRVDRDGVVDEDVNAEATPEQFIGKVGEGNDDLATIARDATIKYPAHLDNAIHHFCMETGVTEATVFGALYPKKVDWHACEKMLAKRPWNAALKTLCWKMGDCFVKQSNNKDSLYGRLYRQRKVREVERSERGEFKEQAAQTLKERNIGKNDTRAAYEAGRYPAGRLDQMARRHAVKVFLSHYWEKAWRLQHPGEKRVLPWVIAHGGHVDLIEPEVPYNAVP